MLLAGQCVLHSISYCILTLADVTMYWFADESDLDEVRGEKWFSELLGRVAERDKKRHDRYSAAPRDASRCAMM